VPLLVEILVPQQDKNPSKDRHFRAVRPRVGAQDQTATATAGLARRPATLILYTDGLIERRQETLTQGLGRLQALWAGKNDSRIEDICDTLLTHQLGLSKTTTSRSSCHAYSTEPPWTKLQPDRPLARAPGRLSLGRLVSWGWRLTTTRTRTHTSSSVRSGSGTSASRTC